MNDKRIEANRYDLRAKTKLNSNIHQPFPILNSHLNQPYEAYQEMFKVLPKGSQILEIGAGMGENTEFLLKLGFKVCSTDISSKSVEVMQKDFLIMTISLLRKLIWNCCHLRITHLT